MFKYDDDLKPILYHDLGNWVLAWSICAFRGVLREAKRFAKVVRTTQDLMGVKREHYRQNYS